MRERRGQQRQADDVSAVPQLSEVSGRDSDAVGSTVADPAVEPEERRRGFDLLEDERGAVIEAGTSEQDEGAPTEEDRPAGADGMDKGPIAPALEAANAASAVEAHVASEDSLPKLQALTRLLAGEDLLRKVTEMDDIDKANEVAMQGAAVSGETVEEIPAPEPEAREEMVLEDSSLVPDDVFAPEEASEKAPSAESPEPFPQPTPQPQPTPTPRPLDPPIPEPLKPVPDPLQPPVPEPLEPPTPEPLEPPTPEPLQPPIPEPARPRGSESLEQAPEPPSRPGGQNQVPQHLLDPDVLRMMREEEDEYEDDLPEWMSQPAEISLGPEEAGDNGFDDLERFGVDTTHLTPKQRKRLRKRLHRLGPDPAVEDVRAALHFSETEDH